MAALAPTRPSREALVLAASIPLLGLHERYAPDVTFSLSSTSISISIGDVALAATLAAAAAAGVRLGVEPLRRRGSILWPAAALLALVAAGALLGPVLTDGYPLAEKLVSAAKFVAYGGLVLAVPLIVRVSADVLALAVSITATAAAATLVGVLQLIGLLGNLDHTPAGRRMPSFLGYHDFAALSGVALGLAIAGIAVGWWPRLRPLIAMAALAGALGVVIAGSLAGMAALALGGVVAVAAMAAHGLLSFGRVAAVTGLIALSLTGSLVLRGGDVADFIGFLGNENASRADVETYSQRTVLLYLGLRIFADRPLTGAGWQGSELPSSFEPFLADARRRFPEVAPEAFPSRKRRFGVQNAYVQAAADLGIAGLVASLTLVVAGIGRGLAATLRPRGAETPWALAVTLALLVCAAVWAALGLVPGVPATALLWIALGGAVALPRS